MNFRILQRRSAAVALGAALFTAGTAPALADRPGHDRDRVFNHVGTFHVPMNLPAAEPFSSLTSAEIVDVSEDGRTLLYTNALTERLGFVDIRNPKKPRPAGEIELSGSPTSVAVKGKFALVAVTTSPDFVSPSGELWVVNIQQRTVVRTFVLAGQPDSVAVSPDQNYAAIVIENERDEDLNAGLIPQLPGGALQVLDTRGNPARWSLSTLDLTGLADVAPLDPEPEFVDINEKNRAVVTLQENNHLVVIDLATRHVVSHFSAGSATLENIDSVEEEMGPQETGLIELTDTITRRREPDAVAWIDNDTFATANEGDYADESGDEGGSRGFTLFNIDGEVEYESGSSFEHLLASIGHFPQARAENKGGEPEGVEVAKIDGRTLLFIGAERANVVAVYDVTYGTPEFLQVLPTGIGPEGIKAIPSRGLLAVSAEVDGLDEGFAIRAIITLYELEQGAARYPMLVSGLEAGVPMPWVAISGLAGDPHDADIVYAVSDAYLAQGFIYKVDVSDEPAKIVARIPVGLADGSLDLEGIAVRSEGGFWLASEGLVSGRDNAVLQVSADGQVLRTVTLPPALVAHATGSGFEGVAVTGRAQSGDETLYVAVQREWADDPRGLVKLGRYDVASDTWSFAHYPLDRVESPGGGWVGLSEITALPNGKLAIIERDNQIALDARVKRLYRVDPRSVPFAAYGQPLPVVRKVAMRDLLNALDERSITVPDKIEGMAVTADNRRFVATDNDGVDENYGETLFFQIGGGGQDD